MKKHILVILSILLVFGQLSAKKIVVERPAFSVRLNDNFEIEKIIIDKEATTLYMRGYAKDWHREFDDIFLNVDGEEYPLVEEIRFAITGIRMEYNVFSLVFPPIPAETERFDLLTRTKDWMIWDIELKRPKKNSKPSTAHIPDGFIKAAIITDDGKGLEAPQWKAADARLKGVFAGYKPEMGFGIVIHVDNNITGKQETYQIDVNADGTFELAVPKTVTQQVLFRVVYNDGNNERIRFNNYIVLSPDEETHICIDLPAHFREKSQLRWDKLIAPKILYFAGANAEINNQYFDMYNGVYRQKIYKAVIFNDAIVEMSAQEYKEYVMNIKNQCIADMNENSSITLKMKEFFRLDMEYEAAMCLDFHFFKRDAYNRLQSTNQNLSTGFISPKLDEEYYLYLKDLPLNDYISLYFNLYNNTVQDCKSFRIDQDDELQIPEFTLDMLIPQMIESGKIAQEDMELSKYLLELSINPPDSFTPSYSIEIINKFQFFVEKYQTVLEKTASEIINNMGSKSLINIIERSEGLLFDLIECQKISSSLKQMTPLTEENFERLKQMKESFYAEYITTLNERILEKIEYNKSRQDYRAYDVQNKEADELFEAIIGKEKGKVVMIDFWATWCSPCISANAQFSSHKSKLDANKVTFVYITDESSPIDAWQNMIPELSGEHYRLKRNQYDYMKQRLNVAVNRIPSYLILDKNGDKTFFQTGFPGVEAILNKINEALAK